MTVLRVGVLIVFVGSAILVAAVCGKVLKDAGSLFWEVINDHRP